MRWLDHLRLRCSHHGCHLLRTVIASCHLSSFTTPIHYPCGWTKILGSGQFRKAKVGEQVSDQDGKGGSLSQAVSFWHWRCF